jgi:hypothetical protein
MRTSLASPHRRILLGTLACCLLASEVAAQAPLLGSPTAPTSPNWLPSDPLMASPAETFGGAVPQLWTWQLLPDHLLYRSYLAAPGEARLSSNWLYDTDQGWIWDFTIGARVGLLRFGSPPGAQPEGWQLDLQGAALPRLNLEENYDLDSVDFTVGLPLTWRQGPWQTKLELRHLSSHLGDEFLLRNPGYPRLNYVRDSIVLGGGYFPVPDVRLYGEADYAFNTDGISDPWHFQFGFEYSPLPVVEWLGWHGMPFIGANGQLRQECDFGGGVNVMAGWQLRGPASGRLLRFGLQYYNGKSLQYSFFDEHEELLGFGLWYDY